MKELSEKEINEAKFNSFLKKTIIFSSKDYYREEIAKRFNELKIIDDENYIEYMKKYLQSEMTLCHIDGINDFIELINNTDLVYAIKSLSDIEMTVIFLLFEKQLSSKEASKILEICSDSVTRIKRRALKKIRDYMEGENG